MHRISGLLLIAGLLLAAGCTGPASSPQQSAISPTESPSAAWKETPLTDLAGRGNFTISGFAGKTVIVPVVSVACATCIPQLNRQVAEAGNVTGPGGSRRELVVLDLDPAPGPDFLTAYGGRTGFTGWSARAPQEMTLQIFHRFGPFAVDTQAIPVILVCPDGRDLLLPPGLKTADELDRAIASEC
jgi:hypothetical protein